MNLSTTKNDSADFKRLKAKAKYRNGKLGFSNSSFPLERCKGPIRIDGIFGIIVGPQYEFIEFRVLKTMKTRAHRARDLLARVLRFSEANYSSLFEFWSFRMTKPLFTTIAMSVLSLAAIVHSAPIAGFDYTVFNGSVGGGSVNYTLGFQFRADQNLLLTDLGIYDQGNDGLVTSHTIGLYEVTLSGLVLQRSAHFDAGLTGTLKHGYRYLDVADLTLNAGASYVIASSNNYQYPYIDQGAGSYLTNLTFNGITYQTGKWGYMSGAGDALSTPTINYNTAGFAWYLNANFLVDDGTSAPPVPEPTSAAMLLLGGGLLVLRFRRKV